jgi:lipoprotein-anchoring transpeptidase ErfK/SrfK
VRPRYGRLGVLGASVTVTGIAMLGGVGVLPSVATGDPGDDTLRDPGSTTARSVLAAAQPSPSAQPSSEPPSARSSAPAAGQSEAAAPAVPEDSGEGRRIVFDQSDQRVWLVGDDGTVERTYLVSGSLYDNLDPGTYAVYSRSEQAWGVDDSGTMRYFVRFTEGDNGAAIGFHDIPVDNGAPVQGLAQLGTPQSHGCIRQKHADAVALWDFAPVGTEVDVTA